MAGRSAEPGAGPWPVQFPGDPAAAYWDARAPPL